MDEDYDAVDLENWFLAMQSADGTVIIPSFHRPRHPAIRLRRTCYPRWAFPRATGMCSAYDSPSRILRPRGADGPAFAASSPDPVPGPTGTITYDVDNDGDGESPTPSGSTSDTRHDRTSRASSTNLSSPSWSSASTAGSPSTRRGTWLRPASGIPVTPPAPRLPLRWRRGPRPAPGQLGQRDRSDIRVAERL